MMALLFAKFGPTINVERFLCTKLLLQIFIRQFFAKDFHYAVQSVAAFLSEINVFVDNFCLLCKKMKDNISGKEG